MGLDNTVHKDIVYHQRMVKTEMATTFLTIHDEIDFTCDKSILVPLTKKLSLLLDITAYYKKTWPKYIRYLFDVEYDDHGSFTAGREIDVYKLPFTREENVALKAYNDVMSRLNPEEIQETIEATVDEVIIDLVASDVLAEDLVSMLETVKEGTTKLRVQVKKGKSLKFYKTLDYSSILKLVEDEKLKIIDN